VCKCAGSHAQIYASGVLACVNHCVFVYANGDVVEVYAITFLGILRLNAWSGGPLFCVSVLLEKPLLVQSIKKFAVLLKPRIYLPCSEESVFLKYGSAVSKRSTEYRQGFRGK
jgi:hypothetical protein